jgi:hypothetical protein
MSRRRAFVAAASHDILQPLNAARLYVTSLIERQRQTGEDADLVQNIDASLEAVEEIFAALLDISRLDTGAMKPELADFRIDELLQRLEVEFAPLAREKGLDLVFMPCSLSGALGPAAAAAAAAEPGFQRDQIYAPGGVLVGCRRRGGGLRIEVYDTGIGIPQGKRRAVFKEFHRLDQGARVARGVGLGLSIVERIARVLDCEVALKSNVGRGSRFSIEVPRAARAAGAEAARLERDREFAHANSGRMPDRIGDRARRAGDADLADALDAERIHVRVVFLDQDRFERRHVGVHRDVVLAEIGVHRTAGARVHDGLLMQRERHAPDHAAIELAAHHARIDDPSRGEGADQAGHAHLPEIGIDLDLGEHRAVRMHGVARLRGRIGRALAATLDLREPGAAEDIGVALAAALVVAAEQAAAARDHAGIAGAEQRRAIVAVARSASRAITSAPALWIAMPAVAVWAEPPAMPASGRSEVPDRNSTWSMSSPRPSAAICASAVQAPWPMSCAPISMTPLPSWRSTAGLRLEHQRRKRRRAHAPADQQSVLVAHLPRRERAALPAEALGALRVAFAQCLRGERLAGDRLDLGIVLEPKRQRIHAAGVRHFVDRAFERDRAGRLAGRAHEQRRSGVEPDRFMRCGDGRARIKRVRSVGRRLEEIVEGARRRLGVMIERRQLAVARRRPSAGLPRRRPMSHRTVTSARGAAPA